MSIGRLVDALRRVVVEMVRPTIFFGSYLYRVVDFDDGKADLQPVQKTVKLFVSIDLPDLDGVPMWSGIPGGEGDPALGSWALVRFINGDPARPYVEAFVGLSAPDGLPTRANVDASDQVTIGQSANRVHVGGTEVVTLSTLTSGRFARYGDPVVVGTATGILQIAPGATISQAGS